MSTPEPGRQKSDSESVQGSTKVGVISMCRQDVAERSRFSALRLLDVFVDITLAVTLLVDVFIVFINVMMRVMFGKSFVGIEEVTGLALGILTFIGAAACYREGRHMSIKFFVQRLPRSWTGTVAAGVDASVFFLATIVALLSLPGLIQHVGLRTPLLGISEAWNTVPLTVGMALLAFYALRKLMQRGLRAVLFVVAIAAVASIVVAEVLALLTRFGIQLQAAPVAFAVIVLVAILLALSVPIGFALGMGSVLFLFISGVAPPFTVAENMRNGVSSFILVAVPFFIAAGLIMAGGLTATLGKFVHAWIGHVRSGLLQVVVVTMYIFSGISGSKVADVAAVGSGLRQILRDAGHSPGEIAAILSASAAMGETIPPSIAILVLGSITTLSIGALFAAGFLPAAVLAVCLMLLIYVRALISGSRPGRSAGWGERALATVRAAPALVLPVLLVGGILAGIGTPTEVASFAVVYGIAVTGVVYRALRAREFYSILRETANITGMVLLILSTANAFAWSITIAGIPQAIGNSMSGSGNSAVVFMLASVLALIVMGALLESLPALIIFGPLLLPLAQKLGIDPLHYAIVLIIAMGIGSILPPIGIVLYAACSVTQTSIGEASRPLLAYIVMLLIGLLLVAFVPALSLTLPRLFGLN